MQIDNTSLAGFDLGFKIQGIGALGGTSGGTQIQTVKATLNSSPQVTEIKDIYGNVPAIGTATGSGTVSRRRHQFQPGGNTEFLEPW